MFWVFGFRVRSLKYFRAQGFRVYGIGILIAPMIAKNV